MSWLYEIQHFCWWYNWRFLLGQSTLSGHSLLLNHGGELKGSIRIRTPPGVVWIASFSVQMMSPDRQGSQLQGSDRDRSVSVSRAIPSIALTASASSVFVGNPAIFTASVILSIAVPGGPVQFLDGTAVLGSTTLSNGTTTLTTTSLSVGPHTVTAVYSGDSNFSAQTSTVLNIQVDDFNLTISGTGGTSSQSVSRGGQAIYQITATPSGSTVFPAAVTFTATGLPSGATYTFSPATVTAGASATNVTFTINVPQRTAELRMEKGCGTGIATAGGSPGRIEQETHIGTACRTASATDRDSGAYWLWSKEHSRANV